MDNAERKTSVGREISQCHFVSFINPTWTSPGSNLGFHNEKSVAIKLIQLIHHH